MVSAAKNRAKAERRQITTKPATIPQYDGSEERGGSRSRSGSQASAHSSHSTQPTVQRLVSTMPRNVDMPTAGWYSYRNEEIPTTLPPRGRPSTIGQPIKVGLNTFNVADIKVTAVYQYDVLVGSGTEKRALTKKVWASKAVQDQVGKDFLFDGERLAWSKRSIEREIRILVDLDAEQGRQSRPGGKKNEHRIVIRQTGKIRFDALSSYLEGRSSFTKEIIEAITFLDHLLRQWPSENHTAIRRNFFQRGQQRFELGGGIEAFKGVYASMRIVHGGGAKARLSVNIDVANGTFWSQGRLLDTAVILCGARDPSDLTTILKRDADRGRGAGLKKLRRLHVVAKHRGGQPQEVVIDRFIFKGARDHKFERDGKMMSLYDYYAVVYNIRLQYPDLPLVKSTRGKDTYFPMELLSIQQNERYAFKLDERQTSNMIRFAVEPPPQRWQAIEHGLRMLDWPKDPYLKEYGVQIDSRKTVAEGRLLPAPTVKYGTGEAKPGTSGRWDLKGKKFLTPNTAPLKSWSVCVIAGRRGGKPDKSIIENFIKSFIQIYQNHGGRVENKQPALSLASGDDVGSWVTAAWNSAGNQAQMRPQILVFILPDKDSVVYGRIKRSAECRYGVVSQCMQYVHVQKAQPQYISNVCMKFNAKLGGSTCRAVGPKSGGPTGAFAVPTMIIGADVSHAAPGAQAPSMAAITVSMDKLATRYAGVAQTNGYRVEMIMTDTIKAELGPLVKVWMDSVNNGKLPSRIIYFRDGVSEGQYEHVLKQEVQDMKLLLRNLGNADCQFVVIVGSKRHHVRFFPERGDRNGNALPGTLVETGVTHAFENDFYLCGHAALKGTARPMHYHVLLNEARMSNDEIHTLIYEHGYQYARATTPVSQFPAIYYAHIVSNRAIPHDPKWSGSSDSDASSRAGGPGSKQSSGSTPAPTEFEKVLPMPNQGGIVTSMWYI